MSSGAIYQIDEVEVQATDFEKYSYEWVNQETEELPDSEFTVALKEENKSLNRYNNVIANDKTRVMLASGKYINANYVCGGKYISCQAPLSHTIEDFWHMVWEQNTSVIIMLTKFEEGGKSKATPYFPETSAAKKFGNFTISVGSSLYTDAQTMRRMEMQVRELVVELKGEKEKRSIIHIHYMGWPDFGVPKSAKQISDMLFMTMLFRGKIKKTILNGPPVVHCSAGVGRTGTFIALLRMYEEAFFTSLKTPINFPCESSIARVKELDKRICSIKKPMTHNEIVEFVAEFVLTIRAERRGMVQTADQYKFIISSLETFYKDIFAKVPQKKSKLFEACESFFSPTCKKNLDKFSKPLLK